MPRPAASFAEQLEAAKAGQQWAFTALYAASSPQIAGFVRARGGDSDAVTNDAFLSAFRNIARFEGDAGDFRAWLYRITRNKLIDFHRAQARTPRLEELGATTPTATDAASQALDNVAHDQLRNLLATLTPDQHDVLVLRLVADLTIEQIAVALDKPVGAVKALQRRALASLRRTIAAEAVPL